MKKLYSLLSLIACVALSSCHSHKNITYISDMNDDVLTQVINQSRIEVQPNDRLMIKVSCRSPELAIPFNSPDLAISSDGELSQTSNQAGYRVDAKGDITFPVLGKLHVEGMTLTRIADMIRNQIIAGDYIKDPEVNVDLLNFKYSVLGAVNGVGSYQVEGDRITLLEAIAKAGDLSSNAQLDRVMVIRSEGDAVVKHPHDIRNSDLFMSPYYYLKPNDIIYVEPQALKSHKEEKTLQYVAILFSAVSAATSIIWITK